MGTPQDKSRAKVRIGARQTIALAASLLAVAAVGWGLRAALRSPLFLVQVVEINPSDLAGGSPETMPVDLNALTDLAGIPLGQVNLFALDLKAVETRLLGNPWIREATLQKRFPQTVSVGVVFRAPKALLQAENGSLSYVDPEGKVFGRANLLIYPDLPVLSGFGPDSLSRTQRLQEALAVIDRWPAQAAELSALSWDDERGLRALASYGRGPPGVKTMVDLGTELAAATDAKSLTEHFERLAQVFDYLKRNSIAARQIWADAGKKIVVKTTRGS